MKDDGFVSHSAPAAHGGHDVSDLKKAVAELLCRLRQPRPGAPAVVRYEWPCPGNLLHMDVRSSAASMRPGMPSQGTADSAHPSWLGVRALDHRRLPPAGLLRDPQGRDPRDLTAFTRRALDWFLEQGIVCERMTTDNAFAYTQSKSFKQLLWQRAIGHIRTRPYTPRTNGKVERFHQTLIREWACALEYASSDARTQALPHWIDHYNERRTHSAPSNRPPRARVRDVTGHNT